MNTVIPYEFKAFQSRDSCVSPKTRRLQGEEHFRNTSEIGLRSEYDMCDPHIPPFMSILAWNVRGVGGANFRRIFRDMVNLHNPTAIILTETHLSGARAEAVITTLGFESFVRVHSMGFTGGIWLLWHPQSIHVAPIGATIQEFHCIIKVGNGVSINFWSNKWLRLGSIRSSISGPLNEDELSMTFSSFLAN
ncbi:hypothetical protein G2W53_022380 [Senna tora]|uniref:Endonuclease/exonuclease/phosphatase domain-containing protein n=1 Tax=Senna tora TaxID=362788 RepID=A0A834TNL0_9FABA|nr:hypothetical protein G2W53_022380 [Senna tora]